MHHENDFRKPEIVIVIPWQVNIQISALLSELLFQRAYIIPFLI